MNKTADDIFRSRCTWLVNKITRVNDSIPASAQGILAAMAKQTAIDIVEREARLKSMKPFGSMLASTKRAHSLYAL